ncbi:MAG: hypothetical protein DMF98_15330 [Acidobacteria bacterium]|nr:MAG: hypothetical protein DMF98_15330 [Acidobacteriota bacterium]
MADDQSRVPREPARAGAGEVFSLVHELTTDALRYWELRRILYNLLLAAIVVAHFVAAWPGSRTTGTFDGVLGLFLLTVLANVAYSVVYIADVFIQFSGFRASRLVWRRILMLIGFVFAAILTHFFASGIFTGSARLNPIGHITHHSSSRPTAGITHDVRPW